MWSAEHLLGCTDVIKIDANLCLSVCLLCFEPGPPVPEVCQPGLSAMSLEAQSRQTQRSQLQMLLPISANPLVL